MDCSFGEYWPWWAVAIYAIISYLVGLVWGYHCGRTRA